MNAPFNFDADLWSKLSLPQQLALGARAKWLSVARPNQITPIGNYAVWLMLAGRGFGKTRAGAEDAAWYANRNPGVRQAIIGPTYSDARDTCVEGESGLLSILPKQCINTWNRSMGELVLENNSRFKLFGAEEPDRLRGPQHHRAWCFSGDTLILLPDGSEKRIDEISLGELVQTRKGPRRVIAAGLSRNPSQRFIVEFGETSLTGTAEHPILIDGKWKPLGELKKGDVACQLSFMTDGVGTQPRQVIILGREKALIGKMQKVLMAACTVTFGESLKGQFQRAMTFITWTRIQKTTFWKTLNCFFMASTEGVTPKARNSLLNKLPKQVSVLRMSGKKLNLKLANALNAVRNFNHAAWISQDVSAATCVQVGTGSILLFQSDDRVSFANRLIQRNEFSRNNVQKNVLLKPVMIESVRKLDFEVPVYNLTVEGEYEFVANGIVVHNCDELGAWRYPETWDQLLFGLRLGKDPRAVVTTTPKPTALIKMLAKAKTTKVTRGSTFDNERNLAPAALAQLKAKYEGTRLGRQELEAEILEQSEGALWTLDLIERAHIKSTEVPQMSRKVVSIDPAITSKAESNLTGIIGAGLGIDRRGYVLADATGQYSPDQWATKAVELYHSIGADRFVAEGNQGGEMVRHTIASVWRNAPITIVHASRNKQARAEPVVALYEQNKISHVGVFPELEGQMCVAEDTLVSTFRGDVKISDIRLDDKILTREGFYPLKWVGRTGEKTTLILKSSSGLSVRLTDNHPVFIDGKGFIRSDEIQIGDRIIECLENQRITALSFKEENIIERSPVITQESLKAKRQPYTGTLGNFLKVQFQKAMMFITEMKIHPIMILTTLNASQEKSMTLGMQHQVGQFGQLKKEGRHQLHLGQLENQEFLFANNAASHIKRQDKLLNFVQESVEEFPIVVAIEQSTLTEVWDLTVDGPPEFFANGILVHNCSWEPLSNPPMPSPDRLDAMVWAFTDLMLGYDGRPVFGKY